MSRDHAYLQLYKGYMYAFRKSYLMFITVFGTTLVDRVYPARASPLYARYLCSRDALGLKAERGRPSAARDDRVSCIQASPLFDIVGQILHYNHRFLFYRYHA